jgi:hypothetical protein
MLQDSNRLQSADLNQNSSLQVGQKVQAADETELVTILEIKGLRAKIQVDGRKVSFARTPRCSTLLGRITGL